MKKSILIFVWLLLGSLSALAQNEALVFSGGSISRGKEKLRGDNEFIEARLMFGKPEMRFGPYFSGIWNYNYTVTPGYIGYYYRDRDITVGLAFDSKKKSDDIYRYLWVNLGARFSQDRGWDNTYSVSQQGQMLYIAGGMSFYSLYQNWLGTKLVYFEAQRPIGRPTFDADSLCPTGSFNKERFRIVGEAGIKQIPVYAATAQLGIDPFIHLGYGWETGTRKQLFEVGAGIAVGYYDSDEFYNECCKLKVYNRQDMNYMRGRQTAFPAAWVAEISVSIKLALSKK